MIMEDEALIIKNLIKNLLNPIFMVIMFMYNFNKFNVYHKNHKHYFIFYK